MGGRGRAGVVAGFVNLSAVPDNAKVLQDGFQGWKAKGRFEAGKRASQPAGH
jgi:hypothetical protein